MGIWATVAAAFTSDTPPPPPGPSALERYWQALDRWQTAQTNFDEAPPEAVDAAIAQLFAAEKTLLLAKRDAAAEAGSILLRTASGPITARVTAIPNAGGGHAKPDHQGICLHE